MQLLIHSTSSTLTLAQALCWCKSELIHPAGSRHVTVLSAVAAGSWAARELDMDLFRVLAQAPLSRALMRDQSSISIMTGDYAAGFALQQQDGTLSKR